MKKSSMTKTIPAKMKAEMSDDSFYSTCCYDLFFGDCDCDGRIEWHHHLKFQGTRVNEIFCILPLCQKRHRLADTSDTKMKLDWIMLNRATDEQLEKYSKAENYFDKKERLNNVYGNIYIK